MPVDQLSTAAADSPAPAAKVDPDLLARLVEAALITADRPLHPNQLARLASQRPARDPDASDTGDDAAPADASLVRDAVHRLNEAYAASGRAFRIELVAGGYRVMTTEDVQPALAAFRATRSAARLSRPALETLAIVAYRQPVTRAQLEAIRGVACDEVLRALVERKLVTVTGRAEELGRPLLYGTTRHFLELFGLASLKDLPSPAELGMPTAGA